MILNACLAILSAILLISVFPNYNLAFLAPLALTPLIIAASREPRWRARLGLGFLTGFISWFGLCNWIQWTLEHHAGVGAATGWFLFVLLCLVKALQTGLFAALSGALPRKPWTPPAIAALWVALEYTHSWTGFEWLNLGNAAGDMSVLLRLAPITGVWGLSFVFALMSAVIATVILRRQRLASFWLLLLVGLVFLPEIPDALPDGAHGLESAVVVQPNLDDDTVWTPEVLQRTEDQLQALSLSPILGGNRIPTLIVWPEAPAPFYTYSPVFTDFIRQIAKTSGSDVLVGAVGKGLDNAPLNSALLVSPNGPVSQYDKVHLVPFGEFVPWPFGLLTQKVSTEAGDFEAGHSVVVSAVGSHRIGTFICYESVFSGYIRQFAANGAEVLFNLSNDAWFGKSQARYQHLRIVRMRAAENRRWIVRATNNGISAVIDPAGRVLDTLPEYREAAGRLAYNYRSDLTFYTRHGDWFVLLCAAGALAAVLISQYPTRHAV